MAARLLELFGIRRFYQFMAWITGDTMITPAGQPSPWSRHKLETYRAGAQYFGFANLFRALVYIWPLILLVRLRLYGFVIWMVAIALFHLCVALLEVYKAFRIKQVLPDASEKGADPAAKASGKSSDWIFAPRKWESEKFYRAIGVWKFKSVVTWYVDRTKLTAEELKSGKKAQYLAAPSKGESLQFEYDTRVGEGMHLAGFLLNFPLFVVTLSLGLYGPAFLLGVVSVLDFVLVLLQRCHRIRVWRTVSRLRERVS